MSGVKVSNLTQVGYELANLQNSLSKVNHELDRRIYDVQVEADRVARKRAREEADRAKNEMINQLNRSIITVNDRINRIDEAQRNRLNRVAGDLYETIIKVNDSLYEDLGRVRNELKDDVRSLEQRTNERINLVTRHINELVTSVNARFDQQQSQLDEHTKQIGNLTDKVNSILAQMADEHAKRKEAVKIAKDLRDAAFGRIDIRRFNPQGADDVERQLNMLNNNQNSEGTVGTALQTIIQIQKAEEEALRNKIIYDALLGEAKSTLEKVLVEVNENRETDVEHPKSPQDVAHIETDYWNRGEYSKIEEQLKKLQAELVGQPSNDRIKAIISEVTECEVRAAHLVKKAANRAILSENRVVITEDIVTALIDQGWQVEQDEKGQDSVDYIGGEEDTDMREGVFAILNSAAGERISIVVKPDDNEENNQIAFIRSDDRNITERDYLASLERIKQQIARSGHIIGETRIPQGVERERITDISSPDGLRRRGTAKKINQRIKSQN